MGRWDNSFFGDDLALDVKGDFDAQVESGTDPSVAAAQILKTDLADEILNEFSEDERDEMFWEESAGLIFAATVIQLETQCTSTRNEKTCYSGHRSRTSNGSR